VLLFVFTCEAGYRAFLLSVAGASTVCWYSFFILFQTPD